MDIANIIAVVIALFAVGVSIISTIGSVIKSRKEPSEVAHRDDFEDGEEEFDEEFDFEEKVPERRPALTPPPPPPLLARGRPTARELPPEKKFATEKFTFHAKLDDFATQTAIEGRTIAIGLNTPDEIISDAVRVAQTEGTLYIREKRVPVREMLKALPNKKFLWISHEVVSKPVSRRSPFPWNR